jgi:hypothetical protein
MKTGDGHPHSDYDEVSHRGKKRKELMLERLQLKIREINVMFLMLT